MSERNTRTVYVDPKTWRYWVREAKRRGMSVSEFLRTAAAKMASEAAEA